jgi:hypothetical protein
MVDTFSRVLKFSSLVVSLYITQAVSQDIKEWSDRLCPVVKYKVFYLYEETEEPWTLNLLPSVCESGKFRRILLAYLERRT